MRTGLLLCTVLTLVACGGSGDGDGPAPMPDAGTDPEVTGPDAPPGDDPPGEGATSGRPVINRDNHVALITQAFAVFGGRAYDAGLTTFPYLLDTASDHCDNDGSLVTGGDGIVRTARFERCRIGADTVDGDVTLGLVPDGVAARGNVRTFERMTVSFEPEGIMEVSGVHATGFESACCTPNDDFYTVDLDYRFSHPAGTLVVEDATTRFRRVDWPRSASVEGGFTMDAPAAPGRVIAVSTPEPLSREYSTASVASAAGRESLEHDWSFATGTLRLRAEDGSELLLEALSDDAARARVTLLADDGTGTTFLSDWEPWREALRWTPLRAYDFAGRPPDVAVDDIVDALAGTPAVRATDDVMRLGVRIEGSAAASETLEDGVRELGGRVTVPSRRVRHACALEGSVLIERASFSEGMPGDERSFAFAAYGFEHCRHALEEGEYRLHGGLVDRRDHVRRPRGSTGSASYRWDGLEVDAPDATRLEIDGEVSSRSVDSVSEESVSRRGVLHRYRRHRGDGEPVESIEDARFECVSARFGGGGLVRYSFDVSGTLATPATTGHRVTLAADPPFAEVRLLDPSDPRDVPFAGRLDVVAADGATLTLIAHSSRPGLRLVDYHLGGRAPGYVATRPMPETAALATLPRQTRC